MSIPNILSSIRLCLMPVFLLVYMMPVDGAQYYAMAVLIVAFITDVLDGYIARKFNMVTNLGKVLDPIADKAMQLTTLICLAFHSHYAMVWVVILVGIKEILLGIGALVLYKSGIVTQANWFGKVSSFVSFLCTLVLIFPRVIPLAEIAAFWLCLAIVLVNIIALLSYIVAYINYQKQLKVKQ